MTGRPDLMCCKISFSKHFMTTAVSSTGLELLRSFEAVFIGTGMMVLDLRQDGTVACSRKVLKRFAFVQ